ncbi:hypothetical protein DFA_04069 [Cavenderia fasciculata]|uniref:Ankyrin repeat-containing protein n=1 Tax=Cavenderia fasciculata TaxID=261658 RepID=F4Q174_CACFS|nr:uncharacterized protein DFA_04069 [Cavenderia fasciculata]EGG18575.1 hypothetical protein DFA_04069 [Cavenderia fasciculata]|eukprot:XP_004366479.1 hypothetical protein DFA_04069 [Cavenderia fasciculata]
MNRIDTNTTNTTTTTTTTFQTIIGVPYIRHVIFTAVQLKSNHHQLGSYYDDEASGGAKIGKDIVKIPHLSMISDYAMPWDFIKHYLPEKDKVLFKRRLYVISKYCSHPNATLSTLIHLLEWSPDYDPRLVPIKYYHQLALKVAGAGHRDILELLVTKYPDINLNGAVGAAARNGHLSTLELLKQYPQATCDRHIIDSIADTGPILPNLDVIIKYLHFNRSDAGCTYKAMNDAAYNGHLDIIKFLHENRSEGCSINAINYAAFSGHFSVVEWLHFNRSEGCTVSAMDNAARNGHFKIVQFLHDHRTEGCSTDAMDTSATLEITQFLHIHRSEGCTHKAMDISSERGLLNIVEWLHYNRSEGCTHRAMDMAISNGHFDIIKFLYHNRSERCSAKAMDNVKMEGGDCRQTIELVTFLIQNLQLEVTKQFMENAIRSGRLDIVQLIHERDPTSRIWSTFKPIDLACENNHFELVKWLHYNRTKEQDSSIKSMDSAAMCNNLEMLEFLHFNRSDGCSTAAMDRAASHGNIKMLEFLYNNCPERFSIDAINCAAANGRLDAVKYLHTVHQSQPPQCTLGALTIPLPRRYPNYDVIHYILSNKLIPLQLIQTNAQAILCNNHYGHSEQYYETIDLINHYYDNILNYLV